jgi:hydrogenase expression/formation protein HypE
VSAGVRQACELLGFDPLYLACEGRAIVVVAKQDASRVLSVMRRDVNGRNAGIIGEVCGGYKAGVYLNTMTGGKRIIEMLSGEQLPRIC